MVVMMIISSCSEISSESVDNSMIYDNSSSSTSQNVLEDESLSPDNIFGDPVPSKIDINSGKFTAIGDIDSKNITNNADGYSYISIFTPPIDISGFPNLKENGNQLYRLLLTDKDKYSSGNNWLAWSTSGGRVRFRTDATSLKIEVMLQYSNSAAGMQEFTLGGISGIDVYVGTGTAREFNCSIEPATEPTYNGTVTLDSGTKEVMINLPLYAGIKSFVIGFPEESKIAEPLPYTYEKPIVFYGSSITQGQCASRAGTSYINVLGRALDSNIVNLGFWGTAFGETEVAEYIASIEMSAFVFDYDYNANTLEKLSETHYPFYNIVRAAHPDIPIIFVSRCNYSNSDTDAVQCRRHIIENFNKAKAEGDNNVYFVDGSLFFANGITSSYTLDGMHPNDMGFMRMAEDIYPVLKEALEKQNS